jgi:hypothetical protein
MKRSELLFELDGPNVGPETVDSVALLRLADVWFRLTMKVAETAKLGLTLRGIRVVNKCVAIAVTPSNGRAASLATKRTLRVVKGEDDPMKGAESLVAELRAGLRGLPPDVKANVRLGKVLHAVRPPKLPVAETPWEQTELRVRPIRVGKRGEHEERQSVELASDSEIGTFTLDASLDDARRLGAMLRRDVDVEVEVCRDIDGYIDRGRVLKVILLEGNDDAEAWRSWFATNAGEWENVENVREELGRCN